MSMGIIKNLKNINKKKSHKESFSNCKGVKSGVAERMHVKESIATVKKNER